MNIGLLAVDSKIPNLALMKIGNYWKNKGANVEFAVDFSCYDRLYISKVFTFTKDYCIHTYADEIIKGGTGYNIELKLTENIEHTLPDYSLYPDFEHALGFTTRGCIRKCNFCIVPRKEGTIKAHDDIKNFLCGRKSVVLLDNNIVAIQHGLDQLKWCIDNKIKVDINQGVDARILSNNDCALDIIAKIKHLKQLHIALDSEQEYDAVEQTIIKLKSKNFKPYRTCVLILVKDIESGIRRVEFVRKLGADPFVMPYRDFINNNEPSKEIKQYARYVNRKWIFKSCTWFEYNKSQEEKWLLTGMKKCNLKKERLYLHLK